MARHDADSGTRLEHYTNGQLLLPELHMLGRDRHADASHPLPAHVHPRAYEICLITQGAVDWWVAQDLYRVERGDVFITRPGEMHGGVDSALHVCELYFLQIPMPSRKSLPGLTSGQTRQLARAYERLDRRHFPGSDRVRKGMLRLFDEHHRAVADPLDAAAQTAARIAARGALHQVLVDVLRDHASAAERAQLSPPIASVVAQMRAQPALTAPVESLAEQAGLSVSRFHERFLEETGYSPNDYRTRLRIGEAKRQLRERSIPITTLAHRLGFSSSQYFATVFKKHVSVSPREYRRRMRGRTGSEASQ